MAALQAPLADITRLEAGMSLPSLRKGPLTSTHIVRWLAAQQNWDKIHHDHGFCRDVAGLPGPIVNGALKQHFIVQLLSESFGEGAWVWRIDYRFFSADAVGSTLVVRGKVAGISTLEAVVLIDVDVEILDAATGIVSTSGHAVVLLRLDQAPVLQEPAYMRSPHPLPLADVAGTLDVDIPAHIRQAVGSTLEAKESRFPVDLSRLVMFADAVMGLFPRHHDPAVAAAGAYGAVVAPPLYPLHGIEKLPGELPLSTDMMSFGREGSNEVGRNMGTLFNISDAGLMNGGNRVEVHSLVRVGERICANSVLADVRRRTGKRGGEMLIFETVNRYWESRGRPLLTERQTIINRLDAGIGPNIPYPVS
ncbi:MAG: MaoC family dehydratase N-terminal domain-containing protein [Burkholderiaceae bacterium]